jgi:hypothetical protein
MTGETRQEMIMKWTHRIYCVIWLVTTGIFGVLAYESYQALHTTLLRFSTMMPTERVSVKLEGVDFGRAFNEIAEMTNKNIDALENSIRRTAKLTFVLNSISCFMAFIGFVAQIFDHRNNNQGGRE